MIAKGSCLCKRVAYEVDLPFERFMYCHCSRCRKATGAAHAANGFVKPEAFRWTKGESEVQRYDIPEAKRVLRPGSADFEGEDLAARLARRRRNWIADVRIEGSIRSA